ncbi:MAG: nucleoside diphosphate kinase regulator [Rhodospirillales bacterium]|nr:nucleoside diphosphate kinase regulator [Rhodospirillales bacterium]
MENERWTRTQSLPEIKVTKADLGKLDAMLAHRSPIRSWKAVEILVRELLRAEIVDEHEIPAHIVTMGSRVEFREAENELSTVATLVYPGDSGLYEDAVSVLTPIGAILLGLSEGQSMRYSGPDGKPKTISVKKILHQPEAAQRT